MGALQSNKSRTVAERFDWVHTVDRVRIARRLSDQRPAWAQPLNVCLQVNVSGEPSKSGVRIDGASDLAAAVADLPHLRLRGLMALPEPAPDSTNSAPRSGRSSKCTSGCAPTVIRSIPCPWE